MRMTSLAMVFAAGTIGAWLRPVGAQSGPPPAPVRPVTETLHGITTTDPYRWMEKPDNPEFLEWMRAQGRYARERIDGIPGRAALLRRLQALARGVTSTDQVVAAGDDLFFLRIDVGARQNKLVVRSRDRERVLFDPAAATQSGAPHVSIDNFAPSPDGRFVAINVGQGGGEITHIRLVDTATATMRPEIVERSWGELPVSWLPDASGFFYAQMADSAAGTRDRLLGQRVRLHRLGTVAADDPVLLGPGVNPTMPFSPREFPAISAPEGSDWLLASGAGARSEMRVCVARRTELSGAKTPWRCVAEYDDVIEAAAVHGSDVYLLSAKDAPNRQVLRVPLDNPRLAAAQVVRERKDRILTGFATARDALYVKEMNRGSDRLWRMPYSGGALKEISIPVSGVSIDLVASQQRDGVLFSAEGWTQPKAWYTFDPRTGRVAESGLRTVLPADYSVDAEIESVDVRSFDGTLVPLTILHRAEFRRDGSRPALLNGYAAYGMSLRPSFVPPWPIWLERGGVLAFCHARGGGEKGEAWHLAGKGPNKPNGIRDFIACAEYLRANGYSQHVGALGASGGGVLVGSAITTRPDVFDAAVIRVGVLNTVRILEGVNGANQVPELCDPGAPDGYRALLAMDPYQHVQAGRRYPAVMLAIGLNDNRVSPWHSGKFAARLQAATSSGKPVLIRVDEDAGHGLGSTATRDQRAEETADMFAFLLSQLGDPDFQPRGGGR